MLRVLDAAAIRRWVDVSVQLLDAHRAELDRINIFPVADADTGTNLVLTVRAAAEALRRVPVDAPVEVVAAELAKASLRGARGNSGVIVSQLFRGLAEAVTERRGEIAGAGLVAWLARADELARAAVSRPVEGTMLTVLRAGAEAASGAGTSGAGTSGVGTSGVEASGGLGEAVRAAVVGGRAALAESPRELPVLARAAVVDAGGQGVLLLLTALAEVVGVRSSDGPVLVAGPASGRVRDRAVLVASRETGSSEFDYEVMYLLEGGTSDRVGRLRERLGELGDSVVIVGEGVPAAVGEGVPAAGGEGVPATGGGGEPSGGGLWHVHVHCTDIGAALEAGMAAGRPQRITVVRFADQRAEWLDRDRFRMARAVVAVVPGESVAELVHAEGVSALVAGQGQRPSVAQLAESVADTGAGHVVVLPNDIELTALAEEAAELARRSGREVVVVPTSSVLQGLAALAVHDPQRRAGDDVVAMAEAAAATRTGVVRLATEEALTWAGRCQAGDVLGLVDGEVVLIEHELGAGACQLADRMLTAGGELVTVLVGDQPGAPELGVPELGVPELGVRELGARLEEHLRGSHPEVEVVLYSGGPTGVPLQLGVE